MCLQGTVVEAQTIAAASNLRAVRSAAPKTQRTHGSLAPRRAFHTRCSIYMERFRNAPMWPALDSSVVLPKSYAAPAKLEAPASLMSRAGQPPSLVIDLG